MLLMKGTVETKNLAGFASDPLLKSKFSLRVLTFM